MNITLCIIEEPSKWMWKANLALNKQKVASLLFLSVLWYSLSVLVYLASPMLLHSTNALTQCWVLGDAACHRLFSVVALGLSISRCSSTLSHQALHHQTTLITSCHTAGHVACTLSFKLLISMLVGCNTTLLLFQTLWTEPHPCSGHDYVLRPQGHWQGPEVT